MSLVAVSSTGCFNFDFDWSDDSSVYDDTGGYEEPEPKPQGPAEPTPSDAPEVSGALWTVHWQPEDDIEHLDSGAIGLGLANDQECALLDIETGALKWTKTRTKKPSGSSLHLVGDELIWAAAYADGEGGGTWALEHYSATGELGDKVMVPGGRFLAVDEAGRIYAHTPEQLTAYTSDGMPVWDFELNPNIGVFSLESLADGVVVVELGDGSYSWQVRARRFDGDGVETGLAQFGIEWALIYNAEIVGERVYLSSLGAFGLWGSVFAGDFGGGYAWSAHIGSNVGVNIAPGPDMGVYAVLGGLDGPGQLVEVGFDGTVTPLGDATHDRVGIALVHSGSGGELFVLGQYYDTLELHRLF